jgi:hypothetical protein
MTELRYTGALFPHETNPFAQGEACTNCGDEATHKVGEEDGPSYRHNWTTYLCCTCFGVVMGPVVQRWCDQKRHRSPCHPMGSMGDNYCGAHPNEDWPCRHLGA